MGSLQEKLSANPETTILSRKFQTPWDSPVRLLSANCGAIALARAHHFREDSPPNSFFLSTDKRRLTQINKLARPIFDHLRISATSLDKHPRRIRLKRLRSIAWILLSCGGCHPLPPTTMPPLPANAPVVVPMNALPPPTGTTMAPIAPSSPQIYYPHQAPVPAAPPQAIQFNEPPPLGGPLSTDFGFPSQQSVISTIPNPLPVRVTNHEFAWDQIADVVSDYFPIEREQRVQLVGNVLTEGRIETPFQTGATIFEPQRRDSVGAFNRWESTFQTIRRRASIRVLPDQQGYLVEVQVERQLEDLPRPESSTAGAATFGSDTSLPQDRVSRIHRSRESPLWIPLGRDQALEQQMLADIRQRLNPPTPGP
jgi:hypothetical protein